MGGVGGMGRVAWGAWYEKRGMGSGTWDEWHGASGMRCGAWEKGCGEWNAWHGMVGMKGWLAGVPSSEECLAGHRALNANVDGRVLSAAVLNKVNLSYDNGVMKRRDA
jgi:hypothetical protein